MKSNTQTQKLVVSAVMLALATALSFVKVYELPLGGSITLLSMLPICIISIRYGLKWGLGVAFLHGCIQLALGLPEVLSWGLTPAVLAGSVFFDYLIPCTVLGLSGMFRKKGATGICVGIGVAMVLKFIAHFISGAVLFAAWCPEGWNVYWYSIVYNGSYCLPEMIFTMIAAAFLFKLPQTKKLISE